MKKINTQSFFRLIAVLIAFPGFAIGQTTIYQSGFEAGDPTFSYAVGTINTPLLTVAGGASAPSCGSFAANGKYDGAFITTGTVNLQAGKFYQITLSHKVAACAGSLKLYRSAVGGTYANATAGTLLGTITTNQTGYAIGTIAFSVPANVTQYIGFVSTMLGNGCNSANFWLDDIAITEYDSPPCYFYCPAGGTSGTPGNIANVQFNTINRTSGFDGYVCTGQSTQVRQTLSYNLSVNINNVGYILYSQAWIDWNKDGDFLDANEIVLSSAATTATAGTVNRTVPITIPATATLGVTKMRVICKYNTAITAGGCETYIYTDAEDYDISILPAPVNMVYANTTVTQLTSNVNAGALRQEVLQVKVNTTGQLNAPNATQMVFTSLGTTNIANITNARLYYTGSSAVYSSLTQLGATIAVPPADPTNMIFSFTRSMLEGDNYFWIAYDVVGSAPAGNVIDAKMVSVTVGGTNYAINATPAGGRPILASTNMALASVAVVQNSNPVALGSALNDVIRVEVTTTGAINPITISSLTFRTNGTTNVADIQNARVFYTGDIPVFSAATQFGATLAVPPAINTDFIVTGATPINLGMGKNYFWLTYDVKPSAGCSPAQIDALCNNVALSTGNVVPAPSSPLGARTINCGTAYYSQGSLDMMNPNSWNTARNGSGTPLASVAALAAATNSFYVQNGHSMTTSLSDTISNLYLEPGSYVTASQFIVLNTLYIQSFATYEQTYSQTNTTIGSNYIGSFYIKKDGTWKHNNVGFLPGNSATQYFEPFSIQWFQGVGGGTFPGGTNWGTVILDIPTVPNLIINAASLSYIHGDLDIRRWGTSTNYLYINMDNPLIIDGSLFMRGGWIKGVTGFNCGPSGCNCNADASGVVVSVAGDFIMTGGQWNDFSCGSNASTGMAMSVGGNVSITGGTIKMDTKLTSKLDLVPTSPSSTWNQTGGTVTLGNTNIKSGKTITLLGSKIGDVGAGTALTVETGGKLMASNFPVTGGGNFTLQTGAHLGIGSAAGITASGASGNVQVSGTRSYNSGATYEYYEGLAQATGNFTTTTTSATYPATVANLIINKSSAANVVTLTSSTDVTTNLQLTNGLLLTSYTAATAPWIRIPSTATVTPAGGSVNSYVDGFIRRQGQTDFTFPTGNAGRFARIGVLAPSVSTEFEARYIATPYSNTTSMAAAPITILDHVSKKEHWVLNKTVVDAATTKVRLHWEDASFSGILKFDSLTVGRWNAAWENSNCYGACPANWTTSTAQRTYTGGATGSSSGTIQSNTVSTFGTFTFGSVGIQPLNPLPVSLLAFAAECSDKGEVEVAWTTASEVNNDYFTLERSKNGNVFEFIDRIEGGGTTPQISYYTYDDSGAFEGINYYRLSQTDYDGTTKLLGTVVAKCQSMAGEITSFYNQAGEIVFDAGPGVTGAFDMRMFDAIGKMALQTKIVFEKETVRIAVPVHHLEKGVYLIQLSNKKDGFTFKHAVN